MATPKIVKVFLTRKELEMLIVWCRVFEQEDDSKASEKRYEAYRALANKLKRYEDD